MLIVNQKENVNKREKVLKLANQTWEETESEKNEQVFLSENVLKRN